MDNFTMAELGVFIGVLGGVLTSLILTFQKSKCETIECCCIKCKRPTPIGTPAPSAPATTSAPATDLPEGLRATSPRLGETALRT